MKNKAPFYLIRPDGRFYPSNSEKTVMFSKRLRLLYNLKKGYYVGLGGEYRRNPKFQDIGGLIFIGYHFKKKNQVCYPMKQTLTFQQF